MSDNPETADLDLVTVFATSEADLVPVIKSVLQGAGIPFVTDGESMMNLFPSDHLGQAMLRPRGELQFKVSEHDAEAARVLLTEYEGDLTEAREAAGPGDSADA
ncbi:MAG: hypothetical protein AAFY88_11035 [Acidobacteriota bacterium]